MVRERAEAAYHEKEIEYPVMAGLYHFTTRDPGGHKRYDREELAAWARAAVPGRSGPGDLKNKQRDEIRAVLVEQSRRHAESRPASRWPRSRRGWAQVFNGQAPSAKSLREAAGDGRLEVALRLGRRGTSTAPCSPEEMARLHAGGAEDALATAVEEQYPARNAADGAGAAAATSSTRPGRTTC